MKVLLIAIGTRGDVQPFIVLGKKLQSRGHVVSIAAATGFSSMIATAGLQHLQLPMDFQELLQEPEMRAAMTGLRGKFKAYRWAGDIMNQQLDAMWKLGLEAAPDLILHHFKGVLAPYLARKLGAVSIPVMLQPGFMPTRDYPQFLIASRSLGGYGNLASHKAILAVMRFGTSMMLNRWRKASGIDIGAKMDPMRNYAPKGQAPRIHAYSHAVVPRPGAWPDTEVQTGYFFDDPVEFEPDARLAAFLRAAAPPVYFGFGSMPGIDPDRIGNAVSGACDRLGLRAVVATGWGGMRTLKQSPNIHVLESVPHSWLFQRVSAVVHHGGSGTTHEGLRWGRPSVICPLFADQPFFGRRVYEIGAGPKPIAQKRLNAENLAQALQNALVPEKRQAAEKIGQNLRTEDAVSTACTIVERFDPNAH